MRAWRFVPRVESNRDLINYLLGLAGALMEDASVAAVIDGRDLVGRIEAVRAAAADAARLADAAEVVNGHK